MELSTEEVAERLGVSCSWLYRVVRRGWIPARRIGPGGRLRFDLAEVEAALRQAGRRAMDRERGERE